VQEGNKGTLIIAGTGSEEHLLRSLSSGNGLKNRIFFAGNINDIEQLSLYRNVTALVFPSLQEGFGLAPAEAMACGTPAIVSDRGSLPEIVRHRETGFVLSIDCGPGPWVDAMKHLSENTRLRNRMGMAAMHDVRNRFSWDENAMRATRFFYRIIERRHSQYIT
jgi:glycosyltransferase involved in cell wall biosynthesis